MKRKEGWWYFCNNSVGLCWHKVVAKLLMRKRNVCWAGDTVGYAVFRRSQRWWCYFCLTQKRCCWTVLGHMNHKYTSWPYLVFCYRRQIDVFISRIPADIQLLIIFSSLEYVTLVCNIFMQRRKNYSLCSVCNCESYHRDAQKKIQNASSIFKRIENYLYCAILVYQWHK